MKVLICGSRSIRDYEKVVEAVRESGFKPSVIISGGARGVDTLAQVFANRRKIKFEEYKADWDKHGNSAGYIRNQVMVDRCDAIVAVWDGESRGTQHSINYGRKQGKLVFVYEVKK